MSLSVKGGNIFELMRDVWANICFSLSVSMTVSVDGCDKQVEIVSWENKSNFTYYLTV